MPPRTRRQQAWDYEDPIEALAERVLDMPQIQELMEQFQEILDRAGFAIDRVARVPRQPRPQRPRVPRPQKPPMLAEDPRAVLALPPGVQLSREIIKKRQREFAALCHPDKGGSDAAMQRINAAAEALLTKLR